MGLEEEPFRYRPDLKNGAEALFKIIVGTRLTLKLEVLPRVILLIQK